MSKHKSFKKWIILFSKHKYYDLWVDNIRPSTYRNLETENNITWEQLINWSFTWASTPQGRHFWRNLAENQPNFEEEIYYV